MTALEQATTYLQNNPNDAWQAFVSYKPKELNTELKSISMERYSAFISNQTSPIRYQTLSTNGGIYASERLDSKALELKDYAVELQ